MVTAGRLRDNRLKRRNSLVTAWQDLGAEQNNDVTFHLALTYNGAPFDPTGHTLNLILKPSETALDSAGTTFTASNGLTIVNAALGKVDWDLPHSSTGTPGQQWWRIDAIDGSSNRMTMMMGNLTVQAV